MTSDPSESQLTLARRAREIFDAVLDLPAEARRRYVESACAGDAALRREVEELLLHLEAAVTGELFPPLQPNIPTLDLSGRRFGPYEIERKIAQGGMGAVYEARRRDLDLRVALKVIRQGSLATGEQRARFQREQRILARLADPGIARALDAGVSEEGLPYLVMEYVEGLPIDRWCDGRRLSIDERLTLFERVCGAVAQAHEVGIVHRDLKPSNILITEAGEPKLLDFGIARLVGEARAPELPSEKGIEAGRAAAFPRVPSTLVATPDYAAPEQVRGEEISAATDVYSLGVVLYELLTGRRPWALAGRSVREIARFRERELPVPSRRVVGEESIVRSDGTVERWTPEGTAALRSSRPRLLRRRLRDDLDAIVLKALRGRPAARYRDAGELAADLARERRGLPVCARSRSFGYVARRFARRHRWPLVGALAGVAAAVGGMAILSSDDLARPDVVAADLVQVNDYITCEGETPVPHRRRGSLTARRNGDALAVTILLEEGEPNNVYSVELFEASPDCLDNFADTGVRLSTEAGGLGLATLEVPLPHRSLGGRVLGDGQGSERVVLVLDRSLSSADGDAFVASFPLPRRPADDGDGDEFLTRLVREEGRTIAGTLDSLEAAVRARPAAPERWYVLGDFLFHYGPLVGRPSGTARRPLGRALALDPDHDLARLHLLYLEARAGETAAVDSVTRRLETSDLSPGTRRQIQVIQALFGLEAEPFHPSSYADSSSEIVVRRLNDVLRYTRNLEAGRLLAEQLVDPFRSLPVRALGRVSLARIAAARGRRQEAVRHLTELEPAAPFLALSERVLLAVNPLLHTSADTLQALRARLGAIHLSPDARIVRPPTVTSPRPADRSLLDYLSELLALRLGKRAGVDSAVTTPGRRAEASTDAPPTDPVSAYLYDALAARRLEAEGKLEEALRVRQRMEIPVLALEEAAAAFFAVERAREGELSRSLGYRAEALDLFESLPEFTALDIVHLPLAELRRGEQLDERGRTEAAARHYEAFLRLWSDPDPDLLARVERVRRRLEVLAPPPP